MKEIKDKNVENLKKMKKISKKYHELSPMQSLASRVFSMSKTIKNDGKEILNIRHFKEQVNKMVPEIVSRLLSELEKMGCIKKKGRIYILTEFGVNFRRDMQMCILYGFC